MRLTNPSICLILILMITAVNTQSVLATLPSSSKSSSSQSAQALDAATDIIGTWDGDPTTLGGASATLKFYKGGKFKFDYKLESPSVITTKTGNGTWKATSGKIVVSYTQIGVVKLKALNRTTRGVSQQKLTLKFTSKTKVHDSHGSVFNRD